MTTINILLLEDTESEINDFNRAKEKLESECSDYEFNFDIYKKINDKMYSNLLKNDYDFAIIDLKLGGNNWEGSEEFDGNKFIEHIYEKLNIPIIINTANSDSLDERFEINQNNSLFFLVDHNELELKDGETIQLYILKHISELYKTGITKVIGKHGKVNEILNKLIWNGGLDNIKEWEKCDSLEKAEKSLGRYILSHIHHELSGDYEDFHPEEVYLKNMGDNKYVTGTILEKDGNYFIILTPACDIAQDRCDYFLVAEIESNVNLDEFKKSLKKAIDKLHKCPDEDCKNKKLNSIKKSLDNYKSSNSKKDKFLPKSTLFVGGYIRFDRLHKINLSEIKSYKILCYVSEHFLADIIADFGYYYSRQGQPNLANKIIISNLLE